MLKIAISNFKSIDNIVFELAPLTILLGPPASGKSNILDALALVGYFNRFLVLDREYDNNASNLEPLTLIARFIDDSQLFKYGDLTKRIIIAIISNRESLKLDIYYERGRMNLRMNGINIPWDLKSLPPNPMYEVRNALNRVLSGKKLIEARLYGYDRHGLSMSTCVSPISCGFHSRLRNINTRPVPKNILSELGWNVHVIIRRLPDVIIDLNNTVMETTNEKLN